MELKLKAAKEGKTMAISIDLEGVTLRDSSDIKQEKKLFSLWSKEKRVRGLQKCV